SKPTKSSAVRIKEAPAADNKLAEKLEVTLKIESLETDQDGPPQAAAAAETKDEEPEEAEETLVAAQSSQTAKKAKKGKKSKRKKSAKAENADDQTADRDNGGKSAKAKKKKRSGKGGGGGGGGDRPFSAPVVGSGKLVYNRQPVIINTRKHFSEIETDGLKECRTIYEKFCSYGLSIDMDKLK
uniref:AHD domain-containing protein n=1 Tax=Macrostomum lignano TaxID=282301 RepID=A0A1I8JHW3_9PLAT